jgi:hypothetical protein
MPNFLKIYEVNFCKNLSIPYKFCRPISRGVRVRIGHPDMGEARRRRNSQSFISPQFLSCFAKFVRDELLYN